MIVADASVAVKWLLAETHSDNAEALYHDCARRDEPIVAPYLLPFEIANVLRQYMRRTGTSLVAVQRLMAWFLTLSVTLVDPPGLYERALGLADAHGMPAAYDAHYLALAEHFGCTLWTADQRLLRLVALPYVQAISAYPAP